jgi:hypothetical protein
VVYLLLTKSACPFTLCRGFFTPKIVGTFYMQGYKVKEKTAIVPPVSKLSGHPAKYLQVKSTYSKKLILNNHFQIQRLSAHVDIRDRTVLKHKAN